MLNLLLLLWFSYDFERWRANDFEANHADPSRRKIYVGPKVEKAVFCSKKPPKRKQSAEKVSNLKPGTEESFDLQHERFI